MFNFAGVPNVPFPHLKNATNVWPYGPAFGSKSSQWCLVWVCSEDIFQHRAEQKNSCSALAGNSKKSSGPLFAPTFRHSVYVCICVCECARTGGNDGSLVRVANLNGLRDESVFKRAEQNTKWLSLVCGSGLDVAFNTCWVIGWKTVHLIETPQLLLTMSFPNFKQLPGVFITREWAKRT